MKLCNTCHINKEYAEFHLSPTHADGYMNICKECRNIKYNKASFARIIRKIYFQQVVLSRKRGHPIPAYTVEQLLTWAEQQPNKQKIWDTYVANNYLTKLKPSIDRINPNKGYYIGNIQLMTWDENRKKGGQDQKNSTHLTRHRPVQAYHLDGTFYKEFPSVADAARHVKGHDTSIHRVANGKPISTGKGRFTIPKQHRSFIWKWVSP